MEFERYTEHFSGIAMLAGLWAIVAPFAWSVGSTLTWSNVAAGAAVAALAGYTAYRALDDELAHPAIPGLAVLGGLWLLVAPFVLAPGVDAFLYSNVVAGALTAILGGLVLYAATEFGASPGGEPAA